jgi:serine protease Do
LPLEFWLGVSIQNLDKDIAEAIGLKDLSGVIVSDLTENSPAGKAGIRRGYVIVGLNGEKITFQDRLRDTVAAMGAGAEVTLDIIRCGGTKTISLTTRGTSEQFRWTGGPQ